MTATPFAASNPVVHLVLRAIRPLVLLVAMGSSGGVAAAGSGPQCEWSGGFGAGDLWASPHAMVVWDDGTGPALYAGGVFVTAAGQQVNAIARWNGKAWSPLTGPSGTGTSGAVWALAVYDDGTGPALYAGGDFWEAGGVQVRFVARWDGMSWSALGPPGSPGVGAPVLALKVFDDGSGPVLVAGGHLQSAGGSSANRIAAWDGTSWSALGTGIEGAATVVYTLEVWDDGGGPDLYVGGDFHTAGGVGAARVARWDGSVWSNVHGPGGTAFQQAVSTLRAHDDGNGSALYAGGLFTLADGSPVNRVARWDGTEWAALPGPSAVGVDSQVSALHVLEDGSGTKLWITGFFREVGGVPGRGIAVWDGSTLAPATAGGTWGTIRAMASWDDGGGEALFAGGSVTEVGGTAVSHIAKLSAGTWSRLGAPTGSGMNSPVFAQAVYDDGTGPALYAGGSFTRAGDADAFRVARWTDDGWVPLPGGDFFQFGAVLALAVYDDGTGPALYAGGSFRSTTKETNIARWDGVSWTAVNPGQPVLGNVHALAVYDDGTGPTLYAAGIFEQIGGVDFGSIARWDGVSWSPVGGPIAGVDGIVRALKVWNDGSGPVLYVGGSFGTAGGAPALHVARWDGSEWSALTGAGGPQISGGVRSFEVFDDGTGSALYVGGGFLIQSSGSMRNIARWDGSQWSPLTGTSGSGVDGLVGAITVFDDGRGPALYVGGEFDDAGGVEASGVARWDGSEWSELPGTGGTSPRKVLSLLSLPTSSGPALWVGGDFALANGVPSSYIARWSCVDLTIFADGFESGDTSAWSAISGG